MRPYVRPATMFRMGRAVLIAVLGALVLAFAPGALAAAPSLVSVTQSGGRVSASWTLPTGGQAWTVEISKTSAVDSDGYFLLPDVVDSQVFVDGTTSWSSAVVLPAGTYYVHLSGADVNCATCPVPQWSAVRTVVVGGGTSSSSSGGATSAGSSSSGGSTSTGSTSGPTDSPPAPTPTPTPTPAAPQTSDSGSTSSPSVPTVGYGSVGTVAARLKGSVAAVSFRVCGSGSFDVTVAVTRGKAAHTAVVTLPLDGCTTYALSLSAPPGAGKASVSVGGVSKPL